MERDVLLGVQGMLDMVLSNSVVGSARARAGAKGLLGVDSGVQAEV
jgi:hypothetical protein